MAVPLPCTHINPKSPLAIWTLQRSEMPLWEAARSAPPLDQWSRTAKVYGIDIWFIPTICSVFPTVLICWCLTFWGKKKMLKDFSFLKGKTNLLFSDLLKEMIVFPWPPDTLWTWVIYWPVGSQFGSSRWLLSEVLHFTQFSTWTHWNIQI